MKISAAIKKAFQVYFGHFGTGLKFLAVELCMTLAAFAPLLFLTEGGLQWLALLAVPFYLLLVLWARVNAAAAMRDSLNGRSLFSLQVADPANYRGKLLYGLSRGLMLIAWGIPLIACLVVAKIHISGDMDGFTVLRMIKSFGGEDLTTGILYLALILIGALILLAVGCAFHSGDRHAFVRGNPKLVRGHHGKIMLCWLCALISILPLLAAIVVLVFRYLPALKELKGIVTGTVSLPDTKTSLIILGAGVVLTIPFLPLRSLITAAFIDGLEKE